jgi:hypothetical protein
LKSSLNVLKVSSLHAGDKTLFRIYDLAKRFVVPADIFAFAIHPNRPLASKTNLLQSPNNKMPASKFTEMLDTESHNTSPKSDLRLEDLIAASISGSGGRGRTCSETSSQSGTSFNTASRPPSGERAEEKSRKRLSRLLSIGKR